MVGTLLLVTGFGVRIWMWIYTVGMNQEWQNSITSGGELDILALHNTEENLVVGLRCSYFFMLLGTAFLIAGILKNCRVIFGAMTVRDIIRSKWQFIVATVIGLSGALVGGVFGGLLAGFAGDAYWSNAYVLDAYQFAMTFGGICLGAVPGAIWLLCLRQRWVLPILWTAASALLDPAIGMMPIRSDLQGLIYVGVVYCAFIIGFSLWVYGRRSSKHPDKLQSKREK